VPSEERWRDRARHGCAGSDRQEHAVSVTVKIPTQLRATTGGASTAAVEGATVAEALDSLFARYGELRERISEEDGSLRRFVNVYVGGEDIRFLEGLATPVTDGAELTILPAVAGG
jgi:molybdopterin synthase sulfur carrier subunit